MTLIWTGVQHYCLTLWAILLDWPNHTDRRNWAVQRELDQGLTAAANLGILLGSSALLMVIPISPTKANQTKAIHLHAQQGSGMPGDSALDRQRSGFSLIEMIAVISIITILMGLLLPAVQATRESSRRVQCGNKLRQVATAMTNYVSQKRDLPHGSIAWNGDHLSAGGNGPKSNSWFAQVLPYLEEQSNYEKIDFTKHSLDATNDGREVMQSIIEVLECPTDEASFADKDDPSRHARRRSYVVNYGNTNLYGDDLPLAKHSAGPFRLGETIEPEKIGDGASNTLMLSEIIMPTFPLKSRWQGYIGQPHTAAGSGFTAYFTPNSSAWDQTIQGPDDDLYGYPGWDPTGGTWHEASRASIHAARSLHIEGVNVVMCDGATLFISDTVDLRVWQAASTANAYESYDGFK